MSCRWSDGCRIVLISFVPRGSIPSESSFDHCTVEELLHSVVFANRFAYKFL